MVVHLDLDGYHLYTRKQRQKRGIYPEDLQANNIQQIIQDLIAIREGHTVQVPTYNHIRGDFGPQVLCQPAPIVLVEGLHAARIDDLALRWQLSPQHLLDLTLFVFPEENIRKAWKVYRDVLERNYTYEEVVEEIAKRQPSVQREIFPQLCLADMVLRIERDRLGRLKHFLLLSLNFYNKFPGIKKFTNTFFQIEPFYYESRLCKRQKLHFLRIYQHDLHSALHFLLPQLHSQNLLSKEAFTAPAKIASLAYVTEEILLFLLFRAIIKGDQTFS